MADLNNLTDDELRRKLMDAGLPVGPIVVAKMYTPERKPFCSLKLNRHPKKTDSTRKVYIRKLQRLAGYVEDAPAAPVQQESESDEEEAPPPAATRPTRPMTAKTRSSPQKPSTAAGDSGEVRQRKPQQRKLDVSIEKEIQEPSSGDSTRKVYIRKLQRLAGYVEDAPAASVQQDESESDEEEAPSPPTATRPTRPMTAKTRSSPQKPSSAAGDSGEVRQRKPQQRKLDVSIEKEIQEPSSGGIGSILFKLLILLLICGVVFYVVGLSLDQEKLNLLTGGSTSD